MVQLHLFLCQTVHEHTVFVDADEKSFCRQIYKNTVISIKLIPLS